MSQHHKQIDGRTRQRRNKRILSASDVCHLCGHPGSDAIDHVVPLSRGGSDTDPTNLLPAHHDISCPTCGRRCNRIKADKMLGEIDRRVVMVCGPPGAGKTTFAHSLGLEVFDLDDEKWGGNDPLFRAALVQVRENPKAKAVVIRTGATISARRKGAANCGATEVVVIDTPLALCIERIKERGRMEPPIRYQIHGARDWWAKYEPGDVPLAFADLKHRRSPSLSRP